MNISLLGAVAIQIVNYEAYGFCGHLRCDGDIGIKGRSTTVEFVAKDVVNDACTHTKIECVLAERFACRIEEELFDARCIRNFGQIIIQVTAATIAYGIVRK